MCKEDSPASVSYSDSGKPRTGTVLSTLNRSHQLKSSERLTDHQQNQPSNSSILPNVDESSPPGVNSVPNITHTTAGSTEHGKPPKTPRSARTTNSRSDGIAPTRQVTVRTGDSEAVSIPAATYAMKVGPQTVMSQWIISLDDNLDDEGSDNQHSAKWEDAQEKLQRLVELVYFILNMKKRRLLMDPAEQDKKYAISLYFIFNNLRTIQHEILYILNYFFCLSFNAKPNLKRLNNFGSTSILSIPNNN